MFNSQGYMICPVCHENVLHVASIHRTDEDYMLDVRNCCILKTCPGEVVTRVHVEKAQSGIEGFRMSEVEAPLVLQHAINSGNVHRVTVDYSYEMDDWRVSVVYMEYSGGGECWEAVVSYENVVVHQTDDGHGAAASAAAAGFNWLSSNRDEYELDYALGQEETD